MMNSFNHYSLGSVGQWLYEYVAGIRAAEPGYEHVLIAPEPGELEWARAIYRSVRGPITSAWRQDGDTFRLDVEIPPNVTATVVVPGGETVEVGPGPRIFRRAMAALRSRARSRAPELAARSVTHADLRVDVAEVELDGLGADHQLLGDLAVRHPGHDQPGDRELLRRQRASSRGSCAPTAQAARRELVLAALECRLGPELAQTTLGARRALPPRRAAPRPPEHLALARARSAPARMASPSGSTIALRLLEAADGPLGAS